MGFRFWRRVSLLPGVRLNLSKRGASVSVGRRGLWFTAGPRGSRLTLGIPGTGLFYTTTFGARSRNRRSAAGGGGAAHSRRPDGAQTTAERAGLRTPARRRLHLNFFQRLVVPAAEQALVDGLRELATGDERQALERLREAAELPDGAFLAGMLCLKHGHVAEGVGHLQAAAARAGELGRRLENYGLQLTLTLPITEEVTAIIAPGERGCLLALAEALQSLGRPREALEAVRRLYALSPDDPVVRLSYAELLHDLAASAPAPDGAAGGLPAASAGALPSAGAGPGTLPLRAAAPAPPHSPTDLWRKVAELGEGVQPSTPIHAALLLYRARALRKLGLPDAARLLLSETLRRTAGYPADLTCALRYERALAYEALGQRARSRRDLEWVYARDPGFEDVARRLGL